MYKLDIFFVDSSGVLSVILCRRIPSGSKKNIASHFSKNKNPVEVKEFSLFLYSIFFISFKCSNALLFHIRNSSQKNMQKIGNNIKKGPLPALIV